MNTLYLTLLTLLNAFVAIILGVFKLRCQSREIAQLKFDIMLMEQRCRVTDNNNLWLKTESDTLKRKLNNDSTRNSLY